MAVGGKLHRVVEGAGPPQGKGLRLKNQIVPIEDRRARPVGIAPQPRVDIVRADLLRIDCGDEKLAAHPGAGGRRAGFDINPGQARPADLAVDPDGLVATPDQPVVERVALVAAVQLFVERGA